MQTASIRMELVTTDFRLSGVTFRLAAMLGSPWR
jgi:hypothetical protein